MTPREEIAAAVKTLSDAADDVNAYRDHWAVLNPGLPMEIWTFIRAMNPAVGRALADWLAGYEDIEFTEHGALSDDLADALRVARAVNRSTP